MMGMANRSKRPRKPVILNTLLMMSCIMITSLYLRSGDATAWVLYRDSLSNKAFQPLLTHFFVHADWLRLGAHLLGFMVFGTLFERLVGAKRYLLYVVGNIVFINVFFLTHPYFRGNTSSISGSSSVLYGMVTVVLVAWFIRAKQLLHKKGTIAVRTWLTLIVLWVIIPLVLYFTTDYIAGPLLIHGASSLYGLLFSMVQYKHLRRSVRGVQV